MAFKVVPQYAANMYPKGFQCGAFYAGIKKAAKKSPDLAVIYSTTSCKAAATFTLNRFQAAPVLVSKLVLSDKGDEVYGVIMNSGCANACTGDQGLKDATTMSSLASRTFIPKTRLDELKMLVMSTGVIGQALPMDKVSQGIEALQKHIGNTHQHWSDVARAFMTTDTFPKLRVRELKLPQCGETVRLAGISKGAGMIHPNMATMLGTVVTDAKFASTEVLQEMTKSVVDRTFNAITIDGDTSTNDTFCVLANGAAMRLPLSGQDVAAFQECLLDLSKELAQLIVRGASISNIFWFMNVFVDGEGATKFVTVHVTNAKSTEDARKVAKAICTSSLVKTAIYGQGQPSLILNVLIVISIDANWGRIIAAAGYSEAEFDPAALNLFICAGTAQPGRLNKPSLQLVRNGQPHQLNEEVASTIFRGDDITVEVNLNADGSGAEATMWTCDFSKEYVAINADYRS